MVGGRLVCAKVFSVCGKRTRLAAALVRGCVCAAASRIMFVTVERAGQWCVARTVTLLFVSAQFVRRPLCTVLLRLED